MRKEEKEQNTKRACILLENLLGTKYEINYRYEKLYDQFNIYVHDMDKQKFWLYQIDWDAIEISVPQVVDYLLNDYRRRFI